MLQFLPIEFLDFDRNRSNFRTELFVSDVSELPTSFSFSELPFSISFPRKNMKTKMVFVFTDRFRPFSPLVLSLFMCFPVSSFFSSLLPLSPFSFLWGLSSAVFIRGFISSLPQRAWDKKALLLLYVFF
jgi:hypothetical protein